MKKLLIGLLMLVGTLTASALTVDSTVSDHCVLQQNMQNTVKGTTTAGRTVTVSLGGAQVGSATADSSGNFQVKFNPGNANSTSRNLVVSDGSVSVTISDVLVGEVWLVAGQSNAYNSMDFNEYGGVYAEWMSDINYPDIRVVISSPQAPYTTANPLVWQKCTSANSAAVAKMSPLAFFFAKELHKGRNVPVGITLTGMGASAIGFFMTPEAIAAATAAGKAPGWGSSQYAPCISRFDTVTARGAIWYQGESDAIIGSGSGYGKLLTALIEDWRTHRGNPNFPIIVCGFANYAGTDHSAQGKSAYDGNYEGDYKNSTVRQEQEMVAQDLSNVVVYQNVDLSGNTLKGYARAEHPDQKPESAHRAYLAALNLAYGQSNVRYRCPYPTEAFFNANKTKITVSFPSSVSLAKTGEYVHFPYRVSNGSVKVNPNSVSVGADGHSLEIGWTGLTIGSGDTKIAFCNVSGTPDDTPLYEIKIVDQDGFTIPPFELKVKDSSTGGDSHTHVWGAPAYIWTASDTMCIASRRCTVSGCAQTQTATANATLTVTTAATETSEGAGYRTAVFSSPYTTQVKYVTIPMLNPGTGGDTPGTGGGSGNANGYEGVQLWANGPYWAKCNVGAASETDEGLFFAWGCVEGFKVGGWVPTYPFGTSLNSPANGKSLAELKNAGICDANGVLAKAYDAASVNMGGDWRMPTKAELSDLLSNCMVVWDDSRKGLVATGKGDYASASIFLPCPGWVNQNGRANDKFSSNYLSSTPSGTEKAWSIFEYSGGASVSEASRLTGFPVRGVISSIGSGSGDTPGDDDPGQGGGDDPGPGGPVVVDPTPAFDTADYYVSTTGNDTANGMTPATAFKTIAHAVAVASAGQRICVLRGTYEVVASGTQYADDAAITIDKAVTIFGETGNPADVVVRNTKEWSATANYNKCYRVFKLNDAGAVLSGLTAENGIARGSMSSPKFYGSNIKIDVNGGTVTNCIIRNGRIDSIHTQGADPSTEGGAAIACFSQNGLITHCVITNNFSSMGRTSPNQKSQCGGTAVLLKSGTLRESLVAYNTVSESWTGSAIYADEAADTTTLIDHCTIVYNKYVDGGTYGNYSDSGELYPIWVPLGTFDGSRLPDIGNCLVYGNVTHSGGKTLIDWSNYNDSQYSRAKTAAAAAFVNCATDMTAPSTMAITTIAAADMDGLVPKSGTSLASRNVGCTWLGTATGSGSGSGDTPDVDPDDGDEGDGEGTAGGHAGVQLWANGPYWATMNCGATTPTEAGYYYLNNTDTVGYMVTGGALTGSLVKNSSTTFWGDGWRLPTTAEAKLIKEYCEFAGMSTDANGQPYVMVRGKTSGYADKIVSFPLAGYGNGGAVNNSANRWGTYGKYWTSDTGIANRLCFGVSTTTGELYFEYANGGDVGHGNYYTVRLVRDTMPDAHTHIWGAPSYSWTETSTGWSCKGTVICTENASHTKTKTATVTFAVITAPTTASTGLGRYTATFTDATFTTQTKDVVIPKLHEHVYDSAPTYIWTAANGGYICTATIPCGQTGCSVPKTETVTASYLEVTPATETATGLGRYTATFADPAFTAQTKDIVIPMIPVGGDPNGFEGVQLWENGPFWAKMNVNASSEEKEGSFFSFGWVTGFTFGGWVPTYPFGTTTQSPAVGYTLSELKNQGICDANGVLAKAYDAASVNMGGDWRMPTKADFDALLSNCDAVWDDSRKGLVVTGRGDFDDVSIFLPCPGYVNQNGRANDKFQTYYLSATPTGTDAVYGLNMSSIGRNVGSAVRANGYPVRAVIDSIRGYVPHTHSWTAPTYLWTPTENGYTCTATVTCDGCNRTRSETATATYAVVLAPTRDAAGIGLYTATFTEAAFTTQTKEVELAKLHDHIYGMAGYAWSADARTCTASAKCVLCDEVKTETATATYEVTRPATEAEEGLGTYTATFADAFFTTQTKTVAIPRVNVIVADYYVSVTGSDSNSGMSRDSAFATIAHAVSVATAGQRIGVLEGTHAISATVALNGVSLIGEGFEKTVIKPASGVKIRLVTLDGGATIEGVTLTGGNAANPGAGVCVLNGTISWCCISNNTMTAHSQLGGGVSFSSGLGSIDHSIIAYNKNSGQGAYGAGIGGDAIAGTVTIDCCLIYGNRITGGGAGGGVGFKNSNSNLVIRNCTITGNTGTMYSGGIDKEGGTGKVVLVNTLAYGNFWGTTAGNLKTTTLDTDNSANCLFGLESEKSATVNGVQKTVPNSLCVDPQFIDAGADNYRLAEGSPAIGAGVTYSGLGEDLDGVSFAEPPSIGCYEFGVAEGPHEHAWGEPNYVWIPTANGYACTASVVCECGETLAENGTVTSTITAPASCTADGTMVYMAVFETLGAVLKTGTIPGGHDWGEVVYQWDYETGTCSAVATCRRDASHTQTAEATMSFVVTAVPTATASGVGHYVATFADAGLATQTSEDFAVWRKPLGTEPGAADIGNWFITGTEGGLDVSGGEDGVKSVAFTSITTGSGKVKVGFAAAKEGTNGQTLRLVCKNDLKDEETFTVDAVLSDVATIGTLEGSTDKPALFVVGIAPAVPAH